MLGQLRTASARLALMAFTAQGLFDCILGKLFIKVGGRCRELQIRVKHHWMGGLKWQGQPLGQPWSQRGAELNLLWLLMLRGGPWI
ncbi:hypothetical protein B195_009265 [Pseudomonas sp. Lz4W]|nr:hypothetical protein B195_009265 [Pseudomonas sp. Lz4W]